MNHIKNFSLSALAVIGLVLFTTINPSGSLDLLAFLCISFIILQKIMGEYFILVLLALRPTLDYWRDLNLFSFQIFDINMNVALSIFLLTWSIIFCLKNYTYFKKVPLKAAWMAIIIWCAATGLHTYHLPSTITETVKLTNLFGLFAIFHILTQKDPRLLKLGFLKTALIAAIIPVTFGLWQFIQKTGMDIDEISNRIYGTFAHPNVLATFILALLIIVANEIVNKKNNFYAHEPHYFFDLKTDRPIKLLALGLVFLLALTYTRIAWIGAALLVAIIGLVYYRTALLIAIGGTALFYIFFYPINAHLINNYNVNLQSSTVIFRLTARNQDADSVRWRANLATKIIPLFREKFLIGYGYGTFARVWGDNKDIENIWDNTSEAHNDYIKVAFESGIIGLFLFGILFISFLYRQFAYAVQNHWKNIVCIASIFVYLALSASDNMLHHTPVIWWFWAIWGHWEAAQHKHTDT
jgi:O-antigen ligase